MEQEKNTNIYLKSALTFMLLFILPLGSIYFFTKGRTFQREVYKEIEVKGEMKPFSIVNQNNLPISSESLQGKVAVVNFLSGDDEQSKIQSNQMSRVHDSFDDTEDVYFISFAPENAEVSLLDKSIALGIKDGEQWSLSTLDDEKMKGVKSEVFNFPYSEGIVLVDTSMNIRHYYDGYNDTMIGNLVLHISKVIPKQIRRGL